MLMTRLAIVCATCACALLAFRSFRPNQHPETAASPAIAFVDVTVVPMTGEGELEHQNVVVRGDRIERIGVERPPAGATLVEGRGKRLMPGFVDMHVHLPVAAPEAETERFLLLSLLNGLTGLRSMQGAPDHLQLRARVRAGLLPSPELFLAGPPLEEALTPGAARQRVREQKAAGYDFVKVIGGFDGAAYAAVMDEARRVGIPVVGHVPAEIGIDAALTAHQRTIEHLMGYTDAAKTSDAALDELARQTREAGVYNCPTLNYFATRAAEVSTLESRPGLAYAPPVDETEWTRAALPPAKAAEALRRLQREIGALQRAGAKLLVGSDAPEPFIPPGYGFSEEVHELLEAGLTPAEVLRAATRTAAEALERGPLEGTVQPGALADLVLVNGDPMTNVEAAFRPEVIMVRGRLWTRAALEARLSRVRP
jgi:imidazolonepropionase-like amidohydrolase